MSGPGTVGGSERVRDRGGEGPPFPSKSLSSPVVLRATSALFTAQHSPPQHPSSQRFSVHEAVTHVQVERP